MSYEFIDLDQTADASFPAEAMEINGTYLEDAIAGYRTLYVKGREALTAELTTFETGIRDGQTLQTKRYPARTIIVGYQIIAPDALTFRDYYNQLADILDVQEAQLVFDDEPDKFFIGTPTEVSDIDPGKNAVTGEITIICSDPFKYSLEEYEATPIAPGSAYVYTQDFGGEAMTTDPAPSGDYAAYYAYQTLEQPVSDASTLVPIGEYAEQYVYGTDYVLASDMVTVYVSEDLYNEQMTGWQYQTTAQTDPFGAQFIIDYNGTAPSYPILQATMPEDTEDADSEIGYLGFFNADKDILQFGDPDETDTAPDKTTAKIYNDNWTKSALSSSWATNTSPWSTTAVGSLGRISWTAAASWTDVASSGSSNPYKYKTTTSGRGKKKKTVKKVVGVKNRSVLRPASYGSGSGWHGPTITRTIPKGADGLGMTKGFVKWKQIFAITKQTQLGRFSAVLYHNTTPIAAGAVHKGGKGKNASVMLYVQAYNAAGNAVFTELSGKRRSINVEKYNDTCGFLNIVHMKLTKMGKKHNKKWRAKHKGKAYKKYFAADSTKPNRTCYIEKNGSKLTFNIFGVKTTYQSELMDTDITSVTYSFAQYGNTAVATYNGLLSSQIKNGYLVSNLKDAPNTFGAGDVLQVDCEDGSVTLDGQPHPELGALGNDWENFTLEAGNNQIGAAWSDWAEVTPELTIYYREVFL